jgi:cardiolipin-specific phospholipase
MQTGSAPTTKPGSPAASSLSLDKSPEKEAPPVTTTSITDPYGPRTWHSNMIELSGKNRALNEFSVERVGEDVQQNLVMIHGYGAGLGFFYKNFEALSRFPGWRLYSLDLLGMGRSTRPPFKIHAKTREGKIAEAENWFIDALEEWRIKKGIDRFTLLGHSLGGYMAVAYALKYPGHLNKLILASPVGIPEDPYAITADLPEPGDSSVANEVAEDQNTTGGDKNNFLNSRSNAEKKPNPNKKPGEPERKPLPKWLTYLWDSNISPFSLVRWSGPLGPRLVSGWTSRRFAHLPSEESQALHDYSYSLFRQRGSGEYALAYILAPGAFARSPLIRRIQGVGRQFIQPHSAPIPDGVPADEAMASTPLSPSSSASPSTSNGAASIRSLRENGIPVTFMYGQHDWMDVAGGYAAAEKILQEKRKALEGATAEQRKNDNGSAKVLIVKKAGHHVYLDGWEEFNDMMADEMREVERRSRDGVSWTQ